MCGRGGGEYRRGGDVWEGVRYVEGVEVCFNFRNSCN